MRNRSSYQHQYYEAHKGEIRFRHQQYRKEHVDEIKGYSRRATKWERRSIVAWDGEGCNDPDPTLAQRYVLFANSTGQYVANRQGLSSLDCFKFLLTANPDDINVIFGGNYDANMWLADLSAEALSKLWTKGSVKWQGYWISYQPRKKFLIKHIQSGKSASIWDVFGFFQKSFVSVLSEWLPDVDTKHMSEMKNARPAFDWEMFNEILAYCLSECRLLVDVVVLLFKALDGADIRLARYDGAGAIAAAMLKSHDIKDYMPLEGSVPARVQIASQYAYAGGRIEAAQIGFEESAEIHRHDINSAYPTFIARLPCLRHGKWIRRTGMPRPNSFAVCLVDWSLRDRPFYPFFYRDNGGNIYYPPEGSGYYWLPEVDAASQSDLKPGEYIKVSESYEWVQECDHKPFEWVGEYYEWRRKLKDQGNKAEVPIKLGLNSLYGKMAQQVGMAKENKETGKWEFVKPTYHNLCWAGFITSSTRATLYTVGLQDAHSVIAFATDAVITTAFCPKVTVGKGLGEFTHEEFDGILMVQPGVYFLRTHGKQWAVEKDDLVKESKYRGFDKGTLSREEIVNAWTNGCNDPDCLDHDLCDHFHAYCTRFIGMGTALVSETRFTTWRTWDKQERRLSLLSSGKRNPIWSIPQLAYANGLQPTEATPIADPARLSGLYHLRWEENEDKELEKEFSDWIL